MEGRGLGMVSRRKEKCVCARRGWGPRVGLCADCVECDREESIKEDERDGNKVGV